MGAFFLYRNDQDIPREEVLEIFNRKGFHHPNEFILGNYILWLYKKQLVDTPNFLVQNHESGLYATGSFVYKGQKPQIGMKVLWIDFCHGKLDIDELIGNYCLIFYKEKRISILVDRLNVYHLFCDSKYTRLSSSFLALIAASNNRLNINHLALYEKISKGYIVGPETLIAEIYQYAPGFIRENDFEGISFLNPGRTTDIGYYTNRKDCIENQIDILRKYIDRVRCMAEEYGSDLGLSTGYDSRLLYSLLCDQKVPFSAHTHLTAGTKEHEDGLRIVKDITRRKEISLRVIETTKLEVREEAILETLMVDNLYYFDGRNSHNMGAFSETYTRDYKKKTLGGNGVSFNGLGGEIYRNYYFTSRSKFHFPDWMRSHVFYPIFDSAFVSRELREVLIAHVTRKMSDRLKIDFSGNVYLLSMRRYYSEIRMPDCDGANHNAHNQLVFYLTPFIEFPIVMEGYRATPYIGLSGTFQANMLARLDKDIAKMQSHYGFPLTKEPITHRLKSLVKGYSPNELLVQSRNLRLRHTNLGVQTFDTYTQLVKRSKLMQNVDEILHCLFPFLNLDYLMREPASRANSIFLGHFFHEFQTKVNFG
jgi:hypothetical protein